MCNPLKRLIKTNRGSNKLKKVDFTKIMLPSYQYLILLEFFFFVKKFVKQLEKILAQDFFVKNNIRAESPSFI